MNFQWSINCIRTILTNILSMKTIKSSINNYLQILWRNILLLYISSCLSWVSCLYSKFFVFIDLQELSVYEGQLPRPEEEWLKIVKLPKKKTTQLTKIMISKFSNRKWKLKLIFINFIYNSVKTKGSNNKLYKFNNYGRNMVNNIIRNCASVVQFYLEFDFVAT